MADMTIILCKMKNCEVCQSVRKASPRAPLYPWRWPTRVWQRVHIDFAEKDGNSFLGLVDSHSKWIEVAHMTSTSAKSTIDQLRVWFAAYGLPEEVVSDNGPQFIASEFVDFLKQNGVKQTLAAPYHPSSNGAAERTVQTLTQALQKEAERVRRGAPKRSLKHQLANCLFQYRNTPHSVTGVTPAELFLKCKPCTKFSVLKPNMEMHIQQQQRKLQQQHDKSRVKLRELSSRDSVNVRNTRGGVEKWVPGTVIRRLGPLTYLEKVGRQLRYVHVDHLLRTESENSEEVLDEEGFDDVFPEERAVPMLSPELTSGTSTSPSAATSVPETEIESPCKVPIQTPKPVVVQASVLKVKTPNCVSAQPSTPKIQTQTPLQQGSQLVSFSRQTRFQHLCWILHLQHKVPIC